MVPPGMADAADGPLADRRKRRLAASLANPMVTCTKCGSDRLVPLTFSALLGEEKVDPPRRPVAKCANCGERTYVNAKVHRLLSAD